MVKKLWIDKKIGLFKLNILNLDHSEVKGEILTEIDSGVDVFYDCRWAITDIFCELLLEQPSWVEARSVLVIGAGVGLETLVIGRLCNKLYLNDLAPVALNLCARQLEENSIHNFELKPGRYENLNFPNVDIVIGSYLVYNKDTAQSMKHFLSQCSRTVLLMNEDHPEFKDLLNDFPRHKCLLKKDGFRCVQF